MERLVLDFLVLRIIRFYIFARYSRR